MAKQKGKAKQTKNSTPKSNKGNKDNKKGVKNSKDSKKSKKPEKKEEIKYDYEVKCLLIYYLKKGDLIELIELISNEISTICQIVEITDISDFKMTLKVRVVNNESDVKKNNAEIKKIESKENKKGKATQVKKK